jgi:hypothetical protein
MEEAPTEIGTRSKSARISSGRVSIGPKRSCPARLGGAAQHSIWGFPLIVASSCLGLEGEVLVERQQHTLLVATLEQLEPRSQAQSGPQPRPDTDTSRDTSSSRPTAGEV